MPTILIVDDSADDRQIVINVLQSELDYRLIFADGVEEALMMIVCDDPDLVLTDLLMPDMQGLKLIQEIKNNHRGIPVILITSQGSEEIAVSALREGAASYVPKKSLADDLLETVKDVLAAASHEANQTRLMSCIANNVCQYVLENDRTLIPLLVAHLQENVIAMGLCNESDRMRVGVALEEALVNALYHGNLEISSALRETDFDAYYALAKERSQQSPYQERRIYVEVRLSPEEAVFVVRDQGSGFDPTTLPDPTDPANLEKVSGRGVLLMRTFMSEVTYNSLGNEVTMTKRCGDEEDLIDDEDFYAD